MKVAMYVYTRRMRVIIRVTDHQLDMRSVQKRMEISILM